MGFAPPEGLCYDRRRFERSRIHITELSQFAFRFSAVERRHHSSDDTKPHDEMVDLRMPFTERRTYQLAPPRIGTGSNPDSVMRTSRSWNALEAVFGTADIRRPTDWEINHAGNTAIVHVGGRMKTLETELEGFGGTSGTALPGEIWTVPAGQRYQSYMVGEVIQYAALYLQPSDEGDSGAMEVRAEGGVRDNLLFRSVMQLMRIAEENTDTADLECESLATEIRSHLLAMYAPFPPASCDRLIPPLTATQARLVREYIHDSLSSSIVLDDLSSLLKITNHHLLVTFRRAFGATPAQYVIAQRVRAAQRMLLHTSDDLTSIALRTGFSSHSHLTSTFRQRVGCPPGEFRRRYKT